MAWRNPSRWGPRPEGHPGLTGAGGFGSGGVPVEATRVFLVCSAGVLAVSLVLLLMPTPE